MVTVAEQNAAACQHLPRIESQSDIQDIDFFIGDRAKTAFAIWTKEHGWTGFEPSTEFPNPQDDDTRQFRVNGQWCYIEQDRKTLLDRLPPEGLPGWQNISVYLDAR